jgi:four helix bundle protein
MSGEMHYRELTVWKKALESAIEVHGLVSMLPREETYGMRSQLTRSAVSVPANIAEGWTRESSREKAQFLSIAQGSLAETDTLLTLCEAIGWFPTTETENLRTLHAEIGKMLTSLRRRFREVHESRPHPSSI